MQLGAQPARSPVLVGRDDELTRLDQLLRRAASGTPSTLLVRGEVGAGKSRLLAEFVDKTAHEANAVVLQGSCIAIGSGEIPYAPLVEALRRLVRRLGADQFRTLVGSASARLTSLVAGLDDAGPAASTAAGQSAQAPMFRAILRLLDALAQTRRPVVLIIEDLQWADPSTLDLLAYLTRAQSSERLLLIGSYRTTGLAPSHPLRTLVAELELTRRLEKLEVPEFGRPGLKLLLRAILKTEPNHDLVERVLEKSDGNPFFVEELLAIGLLTADDGAALLPSTIRELELARFAGLGDDAKEVMRAAATAGRRVNHDLLVKVCALSERQLSSALRECIENQMLVDTGLDDTYRFRHAVMREVVHEGLLGRERASLHRVIATALAGDSRLSLAGELTVAAELSYHWYEAKEYPQALAAALQAGGQATRLLAFREAGEQYARALAVWPELENPEEIAGLPKARLLLAAADAARWAGRIDRAVARAQDAVSEVDAARQPELAAEMYERLGSYLWEAGDYGASERAYAEAGLLLEGADPSAVGARVLAMAASKKVREGHYTEGLTIGRDALAMATSVGARPERGRALTWIGAAQIMQGHVEAGRADLLSAAEIARSEHLMEDLHRLYANLAYALDNAGHLEESLAVALEGLDLIRESGVEHTRAGNLLANNACAAMVQLGRWDEATRVIAESLSGRTIAETLFARLTLAEIEVARGHVARVEQLLAEVGSAGESVRQPQFFASRYASAAEAAIWQGRRVAARTAVADGLRAITGTQHSVARLRLCALGLRNEADEWLDQTRSSGLAQPDAGTMSTMDSLMVEVDREAGRASDPVLPDVAALLQLCRAERSRVDGVNQVAVWAEMAGTWEGLARPYPAAYARWREAEAAVDDAAADAQDPATRAAQAAKELGAAPLRDAVSALARRAELSLNPVRAARGPTSAAAEGGLTEREQEVLALLCTGRTDRQIGTILKISHKTVSVHVSNLMRKLGVTNRVEATLRATELNLIPKADQPDR